VNLVAIFHPEAEKELNETIEFYNSRAQNLGSDFLLEVERKVKKSRIILSSGRLLRRM
jgi:hypothetical protein